MIETTLTDGIAHVEIARADKKNALTFDMFDTLAQAADDLRATKGLRAVILSGQGDSFSAGLDLGAMQQMVGKIDQAKADLVAADATGANRYQRPCTAWAHVPVPVIAAVEGVCFGAGMQLALGADFRVVHPDAKLSVMETKWGLVPDMGITQSLPKLVRVDQAKWLMMSGAVLTGTEAFELGLATELSEAPVDRAMDMAQTLARRSPEALAGCKALAEQGWAGGKSALALEAELQKQLIGLPNQIESVMANLQKREPKFS